jgi:hypothetical protein
MLLGIVAHPDRAEMANRLAFQTKADTIRWDDGSRKGDHLAGCAATHLGLLAELRDGAGEWSVVLEEDAVPVQDFARHVERALEYAPSPIVGLYLGTSNPASQAQQQIKQAVRAALDANQAWIAADCLIGSVGYAVRTDLLPDMIDFITERSEELPLRISRWAQARHIGICYTQPSLVDHFDGDSVGRPWRGPHYPGRKAWSYGTRECWCTGSVPLGFCSVWSAQE